jgi:hypothetical protein
MGVEPTEMKRFPPHFHEGLPTDEDLDRRDEALEQKADIARNDRPADPHVFTAKKQDATRFFDDSQGAWTTFPPRKLAYCHGCGRRRWAKYLDVQVFYDDIRFWCKGGCKEKHKK